jgi:hypothetical protein
VREDDLTDAIEIAKIGTVWKRRSHAPRQVDTLAHRHPDPTGTVLGAWTFPGGNECDLVTSLSHLPIAVEGFGSSDCRRCKSHLLGWPHGAGTLIPPNGVTFEIIRQSSGLCLRWKRDANA